MSPRKVLAVAEHAWAQIARGGRAGHPCECVSLHAEVTTAEHAWVPLAMEKRKAQPSLPVNGIL
eukprot:365123-Chlamydomonas_euryale.AAC.15